ncbi:hypothetical protein GM51_4815 [freshwater metagenome]|uniref:Sugar O-methyltransferase n=1 Tax=freshwater metagenome TaxID=449393 RepID=A0A094SQC9_9ZZZZ
MISKMGGGLPESYLEIRSYTQKFRSKQTKISNYWTEEVKSMDYLFNATPEIVSRLRDHCHWISGVRSYDYKDHHKHDQQRFLTKFEQLKKISNTLNPIYEPKKMGGFGFEILGSLVNIDSLKFYESMIALEKAKILKHLQNLERPVIVEIGAGWGGFATAMKTILPNCQYIIVDLPETLIFSGTYLGELFPNNSRTYIENLTINPTQDLVFCDHTVKELLKIDKVDLVINMVSFQEMTSEQIRNYALWAQSLNTDFFYSHNREKSKHNNELDSVSKNLSILGMYKKIQVLPVDYTVIDGSTYNKENHDLNSEKKGKLDQNKKFASVSFGIKKTVTKIARLLFYSIKIVFGIFGLNIKVTRSSRVKTSKSSYQHLVYFINEGVLK